jgi:hypothetical protein
LKFFKVSWSLSKAHPHCTQIADPLQNIIPTDGSFSWRDDKRKMHQLKVPEIKESSDLSCVASGGIGICFTSEKRERVEAHPVCEEKVFGASKQVFSLLQRIYVKDVRD